MNIWRVEYVVHHDLGTGHSVPRTQFGHVVTSHNSLDGLADVIRSLLSSQETLGEMTRAEWLGTALNDPSGGE